MEVMDQKRVRGKGLVVILHKGAKLLGKVLKQQKKSKEVSCHYCI